jgi:hypothetical protein
MDYIVKIKIQIWTILQTWPKDVYYIAIVKVKCTILQNVQNDIGGHCTFNIFKLNFVLYCNFPFFSSPKSPRKKNSFLTQLSVSRSFLMWKHTIYLRARIIRNVICTFCTLCTFVLLYFVLSKC